MPLKLTAQDPESERRLYKIVRRDTLEDFAPGSLIIYAYEETGLCYLKFSNGESEEFRLGREGLRIVAAARR